MHKSITLLPGDGIGPEIMEAAIKVLEKIEDIYNYQFTFTKRDIGGAAIDNHNTPLPDITIETAKSSDAILLGAVGGPKWDEVSRDIRPEQGILGIRASLNLFANLRPTLTFNELLDASPIKREIVEGTDIMIVRELTGGLYFGTPSERVDGGNAVVDTLYYTKKQIEQVIESAFQIAQSRSKKLTSVDKANVLESSRMWRECVDEIHKKYTDVEVEHMYVDAAAMKLVTNPTHFDVVVTENLFGDILSDEAAVLTGAIGMMPSASINEDNLGLYEPIHGSAPDIAGKNIANPCSMILSAAMMLENSFDDKKAAEHIRNAVSKALQDGYHTKDLNIKGTELTTTEMTEKIISYM